ncbi:glycosyltransferase family 4 protein [Aquabacterium sp.]|uniref:glycosyltransferase family 4 protein n=1 Tax=Aquabacterium sp. TaxID=1872578 RepID=UPI0019C21A79|nr:glycosyltransferase family 4 protein [Aquabacterium sp.]MBC7702102.1 glycosyltransferase family 4 protein [Aquabacterium sp.]
MKKIKCAVVTNVPAPYRVPVWKHLANSGVVEPHIIYCAPAHIDPTQSGVTDEHGVYFLTGKYTAYESRFMHMDLSVINVLEKIKPDVVVTTGYIPTYLYAFAWSVLRGVPHVAMTDGTLDAERSLTWVHRLVRKLVFWRTKSFIGACWGSRDLFLSYGVHPAKIHLSPLCDDNALFGSAVPAPQYDFMFCGQFVERKNPIFAIQVADGVARQLGRTVSIRFLGKGPMEDEIRSAADATQGRVELSFAGYLLQKDMPTEYAASRVFLFPTRMDCWGVVINEACAAGVPSIVTPHTGVAGELVVEGENGHVCELKLDVWVERSVRLLTDQALWSKFSLASKAKVQRYTFAAAAQGIVDAAVQATGVCMVGGKGALS